MLIVVSSSAYLRITLMDIRAISRVCDFGDIAVDIIYKWKHANRAHDYTRIDGNIARRFSKLFKAFQKVRDMFFQKAKNIFCDYDRNLLKIIKC